MSYMNCPRCGLSIQLRIQWLRCDDCPRCLGRSGIAVPVHVSAHRLWPSASLRSSSTADAPAVSPGERADRRQLVIDRRPAGAGWVLALGGELDLAGVPVLVRQLRELEQVGFDRLVVDLRELSFMDCSGLGILVAADLRARHAHRQLVLACGDGPVRRLLELTGMDRHLGLSASLAAAPRDQEFAA